MARPKGRRGPRKVKRGTGPQNQPEANKEEGIVLEGTVVENLPNALFRVKVAELDDIILAHVSGKMRRHWIKILVGDKVKVEFSPYDMERARIVERPRNQ